MSEPEGLPAPQRRGGDTPVRGWGVLEQAGEMTRRGEAFALATVVWRQGPSSSQQGSRAIITASGELHGWIGGACAEPVVIREAQQVISKGEPRLLLLGTPEQFASGATTPKPLRARPDDTKAAPGSFPRAGQPADTAQAGAAMPEGMVFVPISCQSEGALEVYIEPMLPTPHLVIVGRSPMAYTLAELAGALGWRTALIDGPDFSVADADERSMVVIATQGHGDEEAVEQAVAARPAYLGLVGSHRRGASVLGYLADRGVPSDQLDRIRVPAGLDLGRTSHQEIAVAILAELVQLRASGALPPAAPVTSGGAASSGRPASSARPTEAKTAGSMPLAQAPQQEDPVQAGPVQAGPVQADALDPVCGMTVTAGPAGHPLTYDGVTYYFCRAGCRREFEKDPGAYVKRETRC
jgi:xanthine dehydrogenase accessory factor